MGGEINRFNIGDKVLKTSGYKFKGTVVSVFEKTTGEIRYVVEQDSTGMLHIYNDKNLEHYTPEAIPTAYGVFVEANQSMKKFVRPVTESDILIYKELGFLSGTSAKQEDHAGALCKVSISEADLKNGSPKIGDYISVNPENLLDQWLISEEYMKNITF